jgi:hypothetical protein
MIEGDILVWRAGRLITSLGVRTTKFNLSIFFAASRFRERSTSDYAPSPDPA